MPSNDLFADGFSFIDISTIGIAARMVPSNGLSGSSFWGEAIGTGSKFVARTVLSILTSSFSFTVLCGVRTVLIRYRL